MYEKNSNLTSIIIAVIAILLILGGVFLLNRSFSNNNRPQEVQVGQSSSTGGLLLGNSGNSSSRVSSGNSGSAGSSSRSSGSSTSSSNSAKSGSSSSTNNSAGNSSNSSAKSGSSSSASTDLKSGEFTARAITPTAKGSNYEIIECNVPSPVFCKPGFKFPYSINGVTGKTYRFSGGTVTDNQDGLYVNAINPKPID